MSAAVTLAPGLLMLAGAGFMVHGAWSWLTAGDRAADHRRARSDHPLIYETFAQPTDPAYVERWAIAEIIAGAAFGAAGLYRHLV